MLERTNLTRDERLEQIWQVLDHSEQPLMAKQIASRVGLRYSTYVFDLCNELCADGDAVKFVVHDQRPLPRIYYGGIDQTVNGPDYETQVDAYASQIGVEFELDGDHFSNTAAELPF